MIGRTLTASKAVAVYGIVGLCTLIWVLGTRMDTTAVLVSVAATAVPVPLYLWLVLRRDPDPEPLHMLMAAFNWGLIPAVSLSLICNSTIPQVFDLSEKTGIIITAPIIEEWFKGFGILLLFLLGGKHITSLRDSVTYACMVGLGFSVSENIMYYMSGWLTGGGPVLLETIVSRGAATIYAHSVFCSLTASGIYLARQERDHAGMIAGMGFFWACLLHIIWNGVCSSGNCRYYTLLWITVYVPAVIFLIYYRGSKDKLEKSGIKR